MENSISDQKIKLLKEIARSFVYRSFMSKEEITICNSLTKIGLLYKGKPCEKNSTIAFYLSDKGKSFLDELDKIEENDQFFKNLGFYKEHNLYKLPLPTLGTYLLCTNNGSIWIEYDGNEECKQSVGIGNFTKEQITTLIQTLTLAK